MKCRNVCMYVRACVRTYVCMYVCLFVCLYVCMFYASMYVCMYVCICMYVYVCVRMCTYACTYVNVCVRTHTSKFKIPVHMQIHHDLYFCDNTWYMYWMTNQFQDVLFDTLSLSEPDSWLQHFQLPQWLSKNAGGLHYKIGPHHEATNKWMLDLD